MRRRHRIRILTVAVGARWAGRGATHAEAPAGDRGERSAYIVQLEDPWLARYHGGIPGLTATNPAGIVKFRLDADSSAGKACLAHLAAKRRTVRAGIRRSVGRTVNLGTTTATPTTASRPNSPSPNPPPYAACPVRAQVQKAFKRELLTDAGPKRIGADGIWKGEATGERPGSRGEGVVVGVIDTGINHDHPSFADLGGDGYNHTNPTGTFQGVCDPVGLQPHQPDRHLPGRVRPGHRRPLCNDKLLGAWDFICSHVPSADQRL